VLGGLPAAQGKAILGNVRSNEPDVAGVVGKVAQGAVDAGFVYITDVKSAGGRLRAIELPASLQPEVVYEIAVVKGTEHPDQARAFVRGLLAGAGRGALDGAGFGRP
jgi:molybdate transport system substrate-binding protein